MKSDSITSDSQVPELLTVDQMADRLTLSRATVFAWMQEGILVKGRHFLKYGRVLRFVWSAELIQELLAGCMIDEGAMVPVRVPRQVKPNPINWEY